MLFGKIGQRQGVEDLAYQIRAVFQQEKQQIQHNAEAEGAFSDQERTSRQILPALQGHFRQLFLDLCGAVEIMIGQQAAGPAR